MKVKVLVVDWRSRSTKENFASSTSKLNCQWFQLPLRRKINQLLGTVALFASVGVTVPANADSKVAIAPLLPNPQLAGEFQQAARKDIKLLDVDGYRRRVMERFSKQDFQGAIEDLNEVIDLEPNDAYAYLLRGISRDYLKNYQGAIEDYNQVIKLDPNNAEAYNSRCYTRARGLRDYQGAIADCNESIRLNPNIPESYASRCYTRAGLGDKKALEDCDRALEIAPEYAWGYEDRALARSILGDKPGAIADVQQAAKLYKEQGNMVDYQRVQEILKQLQP
ncbi:MAG TPA: tetratricopeptide repeat protein [Kamptonema sp.]|nr:tetratricopeptide repeat protein [Kamptonema sp.]